MVTRELTKPLRVLRLANNGYDTCVYATSGARTFASKTHDRRRSSKLNVCCWFFKQHSQLSALYQGKIKIKLPKLVFLLHLTNALFEGVLPDPDEHDHLHGGARPAALHCTSQAGEQKYNNPPSDQEHPGISHQIKLQTNTGGRC